MKCFFILYVFCFQIIFAGDFFVPFQGDRILFFEKPHPDCYPDSRNPLITGTPETVGFLWSDIVPVPEGYVIEPVLSEHNGQYKCGISYVLRNKGASSDKECVVIPEQVYKEYCLIKTSQNGWLWVPTRYLYTVVIKS